MSDIVSEQIGAKYFLAVTEIGKAHKQNGLFNQDSYAYRFNENGTTIFALADGVSSCQNAKTGSEYAVNVVCDIFAQKNSVLLSGMKQKIVSSWKSRIPDNWNDYATTLNFVSLLEDKIIIGRLGDGVVAVSSCGKAVVSYDDAPFYSAETFALGEQVMDSAFSIQEIDIKNVPSLEILLMTDGIAKEIDMSSIPEVMRYLNQHRNDKDFEQELNGWIERLNKNNDDDKTLLFAHIER